jgi:hypothetical protein
VEKTKSAPPGGTGGAGAGGQTNSLITAPSFSQRVMVNHQGDTLPTFV